MAHEVNIKTSIATETLKINYYPEGFAVIPDSASHQYINTTPNAQSVEIQDVTSYSVTNVDNSSNLSFDASNALGITLGTAPSSQLLEGLDAYKYSFPDFNNYGVVNGVVSVFSEDLTALTAGDIICFKPHATGTVNIYNTTVKKVNVSNLDDGAYNILMIFLSYSNGTLKVLHKGFFDYETDSVNVSNWEVGRTIYLDENNKIDIVPTTQPESWVKSLGFCVPNKENKYRVWFEPDSTYIKLTT
tara:strand:- start:217 stop:951 length:735 start_codon:yes stop_codon:yes gene_type:complete